jgi:hypothetical protein
MKTITAIVLLTFASFALSCDKGNSPILNLNCRNLKNGIINSDPDAVGKEISKLTKDLYPKPTTEDKVGHSANFDILVDRLNQCEEIFAEWSCYCCIKTYPPQTEILIKTYSKGQEFKQIIDIRTPEDSNLVYRTIHGATD